MAILRVADTLILSPTFLVRMTIVFLNRKTFQDMSNLALFQLISTDFWLPEELKFSFALSSISLLRLWANSVGPQLVFQYPVFYIRHSAGWMYNLEGRDAVCQKYTVGIFNSG